jgi:hypothetical protein
VPEEYPDQELLRALHGNNWDYGKTYLDTWAIHKWRHETMPIKLNAHDVAVLESGVISIFGRDKFFRPVLLIRPAAPIDFELEPEVMLRISAFLLFYAKEKFFVPGKIENWVAVIDMQFCMPWQVPRKALKVLPEVLSL